MSEQFDERREIITQLQQDLTAANAEVEMWKKRAESKGDQVVNLMYEIDDLRARIVELEKNLYSADEIVEMLKPSTDKLHNEISDLKEKLSRHKNALRNFVNHTYSDEMNSEIARQVLAEIEGDK